MAVQLICKHPIDFVRMMLPHHAGAVAMVDALRNNVPATWTFANLDHLILLNFCPNLYEPFTYGKQISS